MAYNSTVILTGNLGHDPEVKDKDGKLYARFSIATTDSYQNKTTRDWHDKDTVWHDVVAFSPSAIDDIQKYSKGARIKVTGSLSYKFLKMADEDGEIRTIKTPSIVAGKVEDAALTAKEP